MARDMNLWSFFLALLVISGTRLNGLHPQLGWWYSILNQTCWVVYAFYFGVYGFILSAVAIVLGACFNLFTWHHSPPPAVLRACLRWLHAAHVISTEQYHEGLARLPEPVRWRDMFKPSRWRRVVKTAVWVSRPAIPAQQARSFEGVRS